MVQTRWIRKVIDSRSARSEFCSTDVLSKGHTLLGLPPILSFRQLLRANGRRPNDLGRPTCLPTAGGRRPAFASGRRSGGGEKRWMMDGQWRPRGTAPSGGERPYFRLAKLFAEIGRVLEDQLDCMTRHCRPLIRKNTSASIQHLSQQHGADACQHA